MRFVFIRGLGLQSAYCKKRQCLPQNANFQTLNSFSRVLSELCMIEQYKGFRIRKSRGY